MPRYFFDLQDHELVIDDLGTELAHDEAARVQAVASCGEYLTDRPELIWDGRELRVHVYNEARTPLFVVAVLGIDLGRRRMSSPMVPLRVVSDA